jgi:hypothetical protein
MGVISVSRIATAIALCSLSLACDLRPTSPTAAPVADPVAGPKVSSGPPGRAYNIASVSCVANVMSQSVKCGTARAPSTNALPDLIVGGQNVYVKLTSNNVAYNSGTGQFTFNTTVQNLIPQPLGTTDGTTIDPNGVRTFFENGPTATGGTGSVSVVPDGFGTFTGAGQPYYQYLELLTQNQISGARGWTLIMPPTVTSMAFDVLVSAPVQFPNGYVDITPIAPLIHPDVATPLTFSVKTAVGNPLPGQTVTWSTGDANTATVDASGVITPLRAGSTAITATNDVRVNSITINVSGANRSWGGATSSAFATGTNWPLHNIPAVSADTMTVPTGAPNMPVLGSATSLNGLVMQTSTSFDLTSFNLTVANVVTVASGSAVTASAGGRVILSGGTVDGSLPVVNVEGVVNTTGDVTADGSIVVHGGTLKSAGNTVTVH